MDNLLLMLSPLFSSKLMIVLLFGTLFGLILGVLPGLGPTTGGALILPFTMTLDPLSAIVLLTSIYCAGTYGGAITAVLINTPGTPAAAATCLDGYPLAQKGEAGRALGMATVSSTVGGIFSVIILVFFAPLLAKLAYEFGQPEYFALAIFGLTMLSSIGEGSPIKNLIAGAFGILISTIGKDFMTSIDRFTYGINELSVGIGFIPVRKPGKLPHSTIEIEYSLEYGTNKLEMHDDAISAGQKIIIIDDLLATGGTVEACVKLCNKLGGEVISNLFVIELEGLGAIEKLAPIPCISLIKYPA